MTDYAKLYARLCGAIDEVLDELGTIPEARRAREKLQAAILDAEAQYLDTAEEEIPAGDACARPSRVCFSVTVSIPPPAVRLLRSVCGRRLSWPRPARGSGRYSGWAQVLP